MKRLHHAVLAIPRVLGSTAILALSCWSSRGVGSRIVMDFPETARPELLPNPGYRGLPI